MGTSILGNRVQRVEDARMLTVGGTYVDDLQLEHAAWLTYVRSTEAHARIVSIDVDDAKSAPGVVAVFVGDDLAELGLAPNVNPSFSEAMRRPFVAIGTVRYVGPARGRRRRRRPLPGRRRGRARGRRVRPRFLSSSIQRRASATRCCSSPMPARTSCSGGLPSKQADFSECEVVVEERIVNQRLTAAPIEPRSGAAYWTGEGRLVHYSACQGAHPTRDLLTGIYGLDPSQRTRRRARRRRGVRREVAHLSGRARDRLLPACHRAPGEVDRDPLREHGRDAARSRSGATSKARRHPRRSASPPTTSTSSPMPGPSRSSAPCCR